jgi:uncharacterized metal-binding protein
MMASGKVHAAMSIVAAFPVALAAREVGGDGAALAAGAGCAAGVLLTPDLDQLTINKGEWAVVKYLPVIGWGWLALFDLYARALPHRSPLSHWPLVGTAGRLAYLALWGWLAWLALGRPPLTVSAEALRLLAWAAAGLAVSDALHWAMDVSWKR